jgi:hypothetical protein
MRPRKILHEFDAQIQGCADLLLDGVDWDGGPIIARVTSTRRGRAYNSHRSLWTTTQDPRYVTVPLWAWVQDSSADRIHHRDPDFGIYYLAHELAHHLAPSDRGDVHGQAFMRAFKSICPEYLWHHETGYKPRNANAAGIGRLPGQSA